VSIRIEQIERILDPQYLKWYEENGDIFSHPNWLKIQIETSEYFIIRDDSNWLGTFCMNREKKWNIPLYRNPYFTPHIAWTWKHSSQKKASQHSAWKEAMNEIIQYLNTSKFKKIQFSFPVEVQDVQNFVWAGFEVSPKFTYQIDLNKTLEEIQQQYSSGHRNHFKKAMKDKVEWKIEHHPDQMEMMVKNTFTRKNQKFHSLYLNQILHSFSSTENSIMCFAYHEGKVIAGAMVVYNNKKAYLLLSGYVQENKHGGAGIGCVHHLIAECQTRDIPIFDFEGSMLTEVEQYFRGFGGEIKPYFSISKKVLSK